MSKTAIVILNWNGLEYLKMFLGKLVKYSQYPETLIYVADNGSTDLSPEWISDNFKEVTIIRLEKNFGFAGGYNRALNQIDADYYLLINSDIEITDGWLKPLVEFMEKHPDVASCQPKILSFKSKQEFEYAGAAGGFIDKFGYPFCRGRVFHKIETDSGQYNDTTDIFWSSGACMLTRRDAWEKHNGFDDDFFAHMEEIDLCWRYLKSGYRVCYVPDSVVYHIGGGALPYNSPFKTYLNFRNSLFLLYKNLPGNRLHLTLFIRKLLDGIASLVFLFTGKPRNFAAVFNAHIDYYKSLKTLREKRDSLKKIEDSNTLLPILNKSIVFGFYIMGKKSYKALIER